MTTAHDLLVVAADKDIEQTIFGLLERPRAIGIRDVTTEILVHSGRDPGCFTSGHEIADRYAATHAHVLIIFDRDWESAPTRDPLALENTVTERLSPRWGERGACVVIDPEIEAWVFSDSPHVDSILGWAGKSPDLRTWLRRQGLLEDGATKPTDPKRAFEVAIRAARTRNSAALFGQLARTVSVERCADPSFLRLLAVLRRWFPAR